MAAAAILDFWNFRFITIWTAKKVELSSGQISSKSFETRPRYVSFNIMLVWLENAYSRPFWGTFPPNDVTYRPNPKKDHPWAEPRHLSHKPWKSVARFKVGVGMRKKSQKGYISPICGEAPTAAMYMKICVVGDVLDIITCQVSKKFSGVTILQGVKFSIFLL